MEVARIVDRAVGLSRATLRRDLLKYWGPQRKIVAADGEVSRASFGVQACDLTAKFTAIVDGCHA